jgi:SAM-dependent methyltransferase
VTFQRNSETGKYLDIFDNSMKKTGDNVADNTFRIVNFFVGDIIGNKEIPVPFMKEINNHEAFFPLTKGEVRDIEGNIVLDKTVIEIIYSNNMTVGHPYRWNILRTRWDKTERVLKEQRTYGNFKDTAMKVWKSMRESVTIDEIKKLANPDLFVSQQKLLQSRTDNTVITSDRAQDAYYQVISNLCKPMKSFNNWVKSILIHTYCSEFSPNVGEDKKRPRVLDIGCGRGGDLEKMFHARVGECVGIDPDYSNLFDKTDSATVRYNNMKSKYPSFTKYTFIQAFGDLPFKSDIQTKRIPNMSPDNKKNMDMYLNEKSKFDMINSMFTIHYCFDTNESVQNLINNITTHLKPFGYIILTLFDANEVTKLLGNKNVYTSYYTNEEGIKTKLFEITKNYEGDVKDEPGQTINVYQKWISENSLPENLVSVKLMTETMKKAGCRLIDTDTFPNLYNLNKPWFSDVISHEENPKNKKYYSNVALFYGDLKGADKESKAYAFLERYYVFQKC